MSCSKSQIVATIGPASMAYDTLKHMVIGGLRVVRFNFSWSNPKERIVQMDTIKKVEQELGLPIVVIQDLPGPRIQHSFDHTYDSSLSALTVNDQEYIKFGVENGVDYIAVSFVGGASDILECKDLIKKLGGKQRVIAKIERALAVEKFKEILEVSDAIMIARGDLGNEVPLEKIPFVEARLIKESNKALKPVIVATQMLTSMVRNTIPTRAEVTDVAYAILQGSDAVMLSEETSIGKYPVKVVEMMEKIVLEAELHMKSDVCKNLLTKI